MKRPLRETNQSIIDSDYMEFMRRMYSEEIEAKRYGMARIVILSAGIAACIAIIIYQLN